MELKFELVTVYKMIRAFPTITFIINEETPPVMIKLQDEDQFDQFSEILDQEDFEVSITFE